MEKRKIIINLKCCSIFFPNKYSCLDQNHSCWDPTEICTAKLWFDFFTFFQGFLGWGLFFNLCRNGAGKSKSCW